MPKGIPTSTTKRFAHQLRAARLAKGVKTAREFAKMLRMNENRYTRYERAEVEPDLATLVQICEALNITPDKLLCATAGPEHNLEGNAQPGFSETNSTAYGPEKVVPTFQQGRFVATLYALAQKLGLALARKNAGGLEPAPFEAMRVGSEIYGQMCLAPFETIASIGREIDLSHSTLEEQKEISQLALEIADMWRHTDGES